MSLSVRTSRRSAAGLLPPRRRPPQLSASPSSTIFEPLEQRRLLAATILDFEHLDVGPIGAGSGAYEDPAGYRIEARHGTGGSTGDAFFVYGQPQGFASNVLHPDNWGDAFVVSRTDGASFDLESFDYAAGRYGDSGDFVVTGVLADGGILTEEASFSSRSLTDLQLD